MKALKKSFYFFITITLSIIFFACNQTNQSEKEEVKLKVQVTTTRPSYENINEYSKLNGFTVFQKKENIRSTSTGFLTTLKFKQGDFIKSNQLFCYIKTKEQEALKNISSIDTSLGKFQKPLMIFSNVSGFINSINFTEGDYVSEGDVLAVVSEPASLVVQVNVPYEYNSFVNIGKDCEIILPDNTSIRASISGKLPSVELASQSQSFFIRLPNQSIPENLNVTIGIEKNNKNKLFALPSTAIQTDEMHNEFWVMKVFNDTLAIKIPIQIGVQNDLFTQIISDKIFVNDNIILNGGFGLDDSTAVIIDKQ